MSCLAQPRVQTTKYLVCVGKHENQHSHFLHAATNELLALLREITKLTFCLSTVVFSSVNKCSVVVPLIYTPFYLLHYYRTLNCEIMIASHWPSRIFQCTDHECVDVSVRFV